MTDSAPTSPTSIPMTETRQSGEEIGLVGIGLVGSALAQRLLESGYGVVGYDLDPAKGAQLEHWGGKAVANPAEVAGRTRRVVLSLLDSAVVGQVVEGEQGLLSAASPPQAILDTTTGDPDQTAALAGRLATRGITYLDATLSGSSAQIRQHTCTLMVGGSPEQVAAHRDLLQVFSPRLHHLGPAGSGARAKLAVNLVAGLNRVVLAEGLVFADKLGLELRAFLALLLDSPAYSAAMDAKGSKMLAGDFVPQSRVRQHLKDVELILQYARQAGQELPLSEVHRHLLAAAVAAGDGELDNAAVIRELRRRGAP